MPDRGRFEIMNTEEIGTIPGRIDKTKYWELIENFQEKWNEELSLHFGKDQVASTTAQLMKTRMLLDKAKNEQECRVAESRIHRLADWIRYNQKIEEIK